ncbi:GNAT family N-acetyltransferase [Hasllibacter sp. MH4015]|uniref:GNAT family N-acetyltransferase n=1 Tax=Hasllibacter sp. MH4015 TaxID=2854029 RepID=UPI001CD2A4E2|nr:GNAT family protein [Hasllibacter sp. MH4015]
MSRAVSLARILADDRARYADIAVLPEQEVYCGTVAEAFAENPARFDLHGIFEGDVPVGLFKIDRAYHYNIPICARDALGLRAFMIDHAHQGRGIATAAVRVMKAHLAAEYPDRPCVDLTVNHRNIAARACYLKGAFEDTGEDWLEGRAGPQDLLRMRLR